MRPRSTRSTTSATWSPTRDCIPSRWTPPPSSPGNSAACWNASSMDDANQAVAMPLPAAHKGDRQAVAALVGATQNTVSSIALAVVRDVQHSEDIAQEAYLTVWKRIKTLRNPESFLPWLRQITRNLALDHLRRGKARPGDAPGTEDGASEIERSVQGGTDGEAAALADEIGRASCRERVCQY